MNDLVTFEDKVKERLKGIVAELIPEDRWDNLVRCAVLDFEKDELPKLIKEELAKQYRAVILAEFQKPEWKTTWNNGIPAASDAVKALIIEAAPLVLASMIGASMQNAMQSLQYSIQSNRSY